jgi:DNA gyrase subunit A
MLITDKGVMIRFEVQSVSQTGRATLGVRLIKVDNDSVVSTMTKVAAEDEEEESTDESDTSSESSSENSENNN